MPFDPRINLPDGTGPKIARRRVSADYAPLLDAPKARASQQTELVYGQDFAVHAEQDGWVFGQACSLVPGSVRPGYVGWVAAGALGDFQSTPTHFVSSIRAPVFSRADLKSHIIMSLPLGSRISVMVEADGYFQIGAGAYVSRLHVQSVATPDIDIVAVARRYLGEPYVWGGNGARGVDCSGLIQMALCACGIDAPRDADLQEAALGDVTALPERPGDLLFWPGHVGMLATKTRLIHANATHMAVVEEPLLPALKRMKRAGINLRAVKRL